MSQGLVWLITGAGRAGWELTSPGPLSALAIGWWPLPGTVPKPPQLSETTRTCSP